jgi:hypothetical protein
MERDNESRIKRRDIDETLKTYPLRESDAFLRITSKDFPDRLFVCDNLQASDFQMPYRGYHKFYNATLVTPIRRKLDHSGLEEFDTFGFLCVDNMEGGFEDPIPQNILSAISDNFYCLFYLHKCFFEKEKNQ